LGPGANLFAPNITSVKLAQLYGVQYVLVAPPNPIPSGMRLKTTISADGEALQLVAVPDSHRFSIAPSGRATLDTPTSVPSSRDDRILKATHPSDASYVLTLHTPSTGQLVVRITDIPGWHASANGHALTLHRAAGDLMSTTVPADTTRVVLTYQPTLLTLGEVLGLITLITLIGYGLHETTWRHSGS
ncbi:MAG: YfhO family protein, partial [Ferrimicrobium sp.]